MKSSSKLSFLSCLVAIAGFAANAQGQILLIDPASVSATGSTQGSGPTAMIDNSGLSSDLASPGETISYPSTLPTDDTDYSANYRTSSPLATITFNLNTDSSSGGNSTGYNVTGLYVYNYNENGISGESGQPSTGRGLASTDLQYSTDGGVTYTDFGTINFTEATGDNSYAGSLINLGTTLNNVTNIEFNGGPAIAASNGEYLVGLGEVRVVGSAAVPEPSTYAMLSAGLLILVLGFRRKRQA
jgi:hypothetical protein